MRSGFANSGRSETVTSQVCVDASFGLKLVLAENYSDRVRACWEAWTRSGFEIVAPSHFLY